MAHIEQLINNSPNRNTGLAPYQIIYGAAFNPDDSILPSVTDAASTIEGVRRESYRDYISKFLAQHHAVIAAADKAQNEASTKRITKRYKDTLARQAGLRNRKTSSGNSHLQEALKTDELATHEAPDLTQIDFTSFAVGDLVLRCYPPSNLRTKPSKFHPFWKGPFRIHSRIGDHYEIANLLSQEIEPMVHVSRLKPFNHDPRVVNPLDVASNNTNDEFFVEAIVAHRFTNGSPEWEVKWLGDDATSWVQTSQITDVDVFHKYCIDNDRPNDKLIRFIPQKFREQYGLRKKRKSVTINGDSMQYAQRRGCDN
jgi:hypothetical protein